MKLSFFGYHEAICRCFDKALEKGYDIRSVVTSDLNERKWYRNIEDIANKNKVPVYKPKKLSDVFLGELRKQNLDLIVVSDYHKILPKELIEIPKLGTVNFHAALLPKYRGNAPLIRAICNNESYAGTTLDYLDEGVDTGDIIAQKSFKIRPTDTIKEVILKHNNTCVELFDQYIPLIEQGNAPRVKQVNKHLPAYKWSYIADGKIDLYSTANQVYNKIRALASPFPNAFFEIDDKRIFIDIK